MRRSTACFIGDVLNNPQRFSVSQLSQLAGVSTRTLHHYDNIGLLSPLRRQDNGYREYNTQHLAQLQQIIVYRELGFNLKQIKTLMEAKDYDLISALNHQKQLLLQRQTETQSMINSLEVTMSVLQGKQNLELMFEGLPKEKQDRWYGMLKNNPQQDFDQSLQALGHLEKEEVLQDKDTFSQWVERYRPLISYPVEAPEVQNLIKEHFNWLNLFFSRVRQEPDYPGVGYEFYLDFAEKVITDKVSREMYDHYESGFAQHLHDGIVYFSEKNLKINP